MKVTYEHKVLCPKNSDRSLTLGAPNFFPHIKTYEWYRANYLNKA